MKEYFPVVTFLLITVNLAVFLFTSDFVDEVIGSYGISPSLLRGRPYTLITHMFIHIDLVHLGGNMLMLALVGLVTESKVGSLKFALIYFISGLITIPFAFLIQIITGNDVLLVGASGAIFGVMFLGAALSGWEPVPVILVPLLNFAALPIIFLKLKNYKVPLFIAILFYLILNLVLFFLNLPASISEFAHIGGLLGGIIGFSLILPEKTKSEWVP